MVNTYLSWTTYVLQSPDQIHFEKLMIIWPLHICAFEQKTGELLHKENIIEVLQAISPEVFTEANSCIAFEITTLNHSIQYNWIIARVMAPSAVTLIQGAFSVQKATSVQNIVPSAFWGWFRRSAQSLKLHWVHHNTRGSAMSLTVLLSTCPDLCALILHFFYQRSVHGGLHTIWHHCKCSLPYRNLLLPSLFLSSYWADLHHNCHCTHRKTAANEKLSPVIKPWKLPMLRTRYSAAPFWVW